jgi:hypothetical protein
MPSAETLAEHFRRTLRCYDESLLRQVAQKLCRPRNQWPANELVERIVTALSNPAMLDRRLRDLPVASRQLLSFIAHSRQLRWNAGSLVEIAATLGHEDGLAPVVELLGSGLLVPELFAVDTDPASLPRVRVKSFEQWLGLASAGAPRVVAFPLAAARSLGEDLGLPDCPGIATPADGRTAAVLESDGLDCLLRLAALRQQVAEGPLRRTQQADFFKRDLERLRGDPLLATLETPVPLPDAALFTVSLALAAGVLHEHDAELVAGEFSAGWQQSLPVVLADLWASLPHLRGWDPAHGWRPDATAAHPHASAGLIALLLLSRLPRGAWADPNAIEDWLVSHHPFWRDAARVPIGIAAFLLGIAYLLRLVEVRGGAGPSRLVRLSALGQWVLGLTDNVPPATSFPQTLLVQPNLEILAYRQGLTPPLIVALDRFATWKALGPACTLQLDPKSVYRGLEAGESFTSIVETLERHGTKALAPAVLESLRTWANKRERITVYPSAVLFEFASPAELNDAIARGLPAQRLTERFAVVAAEKDIDYSHFRLNGTRDYCQPPERCVDVEADGTTLNVDMVRSDLLLEIEVKRFAELATRPAAAGRRLYRLTPASLTQARDQGVTPAFVARWFERYTGMPLPPAARLLLTAIETPPVELRRQIVLHVADAAIADGLQQWPATRTLIQARLGPTALAVAAKDVDTLTLRLTELGIRLIHGDGSIRDNVS